MAFPWSVGPPKISRDYNLVAVMYVCNCVKRLFIGARTGRKTILINELLEPEFSIVKTDMISNDRLNSSANK